MRYACCPFAVTHAVQSPAGQSVMFCLLTCKRPQRRYVCCRLVVTHAKQITARQPPKMLPCLLSCKRCRAVCLLPSCRHLMQHHLQQNSHKRCFLACFPAKGALQYVCCPFAVNHATQTPAGQPLRCFLACFPAKGALQYACCPLSVISCNKSCQHDSRS